MTDMSETALSALSHAISAVVERTAGHIVSVMSHHSRSAGFRVGGHAARLGVIHLQRTARADRLTRIDCLLKTPPSAIVRLWHKREPSYATLCV